LFRQNRVAASAGLFLDGLLSNAPRKTGWMRAEAAGDPGSWRQQAILGRGNWDADALRDIVQEYALDGRYPSSRQCRGAQINTAASSHGQTILIRWSVQEIRVIRRAVWTPIGVASL